MRFCCRDIPRLGLFATTRTRRSNSSARKAASRFARFWRRSKNRNLRSFSESSTRKEKRTLLRGNIYRGEACSELDDEFADVATCEEHVDGVGRLFQTLDDGFAILYLPEHFPLTELRGRFHEAGDVVEKNEALDAKPLDQDSAKASH